MYKVHGVACTPELKQKFLATECRPQSDYGDVYELSFYQYNRSDAPLLINMTVTYNPEVQRLQLFYSVPRTIGPRLHYLGSLHIAPQMAVRDTCWDVASVKERNAAFFELFNTDYLRQIRNAAIADVINRY